MPPDQRLLTRRMAIAGGALCSSQILVPLRTQALLTPPPLCDPDVSVLSTGNKQIVIVGTAHVSEDSAALVRQVIRAVQPDTVMVELDRRRAATLMYKAKARKRGVPVSASPSEQQSSGAAFYQSLEEKGFPSGGEFVAAIEEARLLNATVLLGDQDMNVTLRRLKEARAEVRQLRADGTLSREDARAAISALPSSLRRRGAALTPEDVSQVTSDLKQRDTARAVAAYLRQSAPPVYEAMIGERDKYMAYALEVAPGNRLVAVVGLAHVDGIERILGEEVLARPRGCTLPLQLD
uniref:TraB/GumN family protein n=1 Tax=Prymnesium polylepis TaxID=72548 RepID=A0A7S4I9S7_9EUKA